MGMRHQKKGSNRVFYNFQKGEPHEPRNGALTWAMKYGYVKKTYSKWREQKYNVVFQLVIIIR